MKLISEKMTRRLPEDEFHIKWAQDTMDLAAVIERDTPKKPIFPTVKEQSEEREDMPRCPDCANYLDKVIGRARQSQSFHGVVRMTECNLYGQDVQTFCPDCGQRLDWSEA